MAHKLKAPRKPSPQSVKAAAARAVARSKGEEITSPAVPITPKIVTAGEMMAEKAKTKRRRRRTLYSDALGKCICTMLARGNTLTSICKRPLMPREDVVLRWAMNPGHPFSDHYARAREVGYTRMADHILDIADDSRNDYMTKLVDKDGGVVMGLNREALERTRIRLDTRKWLLSKALPKIYGDKLEHGGKVDVAHSETPRPTGDDHLAEITQRYARNAKTGSAGSVH